MDVVTTLPRGLEFTRADLEGMPDDGRRYELIDGSLIVTPAPRIGHQRAVGNLHLLLRAHCPPELEVILAPFDVALATDTIVQPDLLVARRSGSSAPGTKPRARRRTGSSIRASPHSRCGS